MSSKFRNHSVSRLPRELSTPNLTGWCLVMKSFHPVFYPVVTWYHVTFENCYISISAGPINTKLGRMVSYNEKFSFTSPVSFWTCGHVVSRDIWKILYLNFHESYKLQTWSFDLVVTWYHLTLKNCYISSSARPINNT